MNISVLVICFLKLQMRVEQRPKDSENEKSPHGDGKDGPHRIF
jgi:hypothetical protein